MGIVMISGWILALTCFFLAGVDCKVYERCELARDLHERFKFPKEDLSKWLCIAYWESSFDTGAIHKGNWDGSTDYGLFQINDKYWCNGNSKNSQNVCNLSCDKLKNDDIADDIKCVSEMYRRHGFDAWVAHKLKCSGDTSNFLKDCELSPKRRQGLLFNGPLSRAFAVENSPKGYQINLNVPEATFRFGGNLFHTYFKIRPFFSASKFAGKH
ncbi:lysozyme C, milk isozyme-like [Centruroides sculpturatus]|uniref:lysozyme C, milk isozyme-like n=1 Tax=Centruroides sculpturatus TaxID=218467 RepID=UPI000C6E89E3|nr:lysozyme C, milk isozyme-like [Centruroides sculpturatus]